MSNYKCNQLRHILLNNSFSFLPRGRLRLQDVYDYVEASYPSLCDNSYLCSSNCNSGNDEPEWHHSVRWALQSLKNDPRVHHAGHGLWFFSWLIIYPHKALRFWYLWSRSISLLAPNTATSKDFSSWRICVEARQELRLQAMWQFILTENRTKTISL